MDATVRVWKLGKNLRRSGPALTIEGSGAGRDNIWLATDVEGLVDPSAEAYTKSPGGRPGTRLVSTRFTERTLVFKVTITASGDQWEDADALWRSYWDYDWYTEIEVITSKAQRSLRVRLEEIEVDTKYDPHTNGATDVFMTVVADDPFWYASDPSALRSKLSVSDKDLSITTKDFGTGKRFYTFPYLTFIPSSSVSGKSITMVVDGSRRTLPLPDMKANNLYQINTDPGSRQVYSATDSTAWNRMNGVRYGTIIPKDFVSLKISHDVPGSSTITADIPFLRPWG